jgi:predicted transposase YdaD
MSETDNPLKLLITMYREAFAAWLLDRPVRHVRVLNVEFPAQAAQSDLLLEVIDTEGNLIYLHIELQGRRSHEPMPLRVLDYMARIIRRDIGVPDSERTPRLHSVVIYVGEGAGRYDSGLYEVLGMDGAVTVQWRYQPLRLWDIEAETLFHRDNPAFLALIGQTRLTEPEAVIRRAVRQLQQIPETEQRARLLTAFVSLLQTEEVIQMAEKILEGSDELLLELPYLQRMRRIGREEGAQIGREEGVQIGREEGVQIGREEGVQIGREEGVQIGREEGVLLGLREAILDGLTRRFDPAASQYRQISRILEQIQDHDALHRLHLALFDLVDLTTFMELLVTEQGQT